MDLGSHWRHVVQALEKGVYPRRYTDQVDVYHAGSKARRMALQIQQAGDMDATLKPFQARSTPAYMHFYEYSMHFLSSTLPLAL